MKIFISQENRRTILKNYKAINRRVSVIDVKNLFELFQIDINKIDIYSRHLINQEIKKQFNNAYRSRRYSNVLYIVDNISHDSICGLKKFLDENNIYFTEFILIDYSMTIDVSLYADFDNVI